MNKKVVIDIELQGTFCNHWPQAKITFNDQLVYFSEVENNKILNFELNCAVNNRLTIEHLGKNFGRNNIWDKDQHNECVLKIQDIKLDQVSIGKELHSKLIFVTNWTFEQQTHHSEEFIKKYSVIENCMGHMTFNGTINFDFESPVYEWLIKEKFINPTKKFTLNTYSGQDKFDYEYILNKINSMKQLF